MITKEDIKQLIKEVIQEARIYNRSAGMPTSTEYTLTQEEELALRNMTLRQRQSFATKKLHQARKDKGLCIQCGKNYTKLKPDGTKATYCDVCLQLFRDARNRLVGKRKSCSRCPNPPLPGKKLCQKCTNELETLRLQALAQGLCLRCKKKPAEKNEKGRQTLFCKDCNQSKKEVEKQRKFNLRLQNPSQ
jgi:hypothetical protein